MTADFTEGTIANRPAAAALPSGVYYCTDSDVEFFSDGTTWLDVERGSDAAIQGGPAVLTRVGNSTVISYVDGRTGAFHNVQYH